MFLSLTLQGSAWSDQINPWNNFYAGDVNGAVTEATELIDGSADIVTKLSVAVALLEFCNHSLDPYCASPSYELVNSAEFKNFSDEQTKRWITTELQNGLVANGIQYQELRKVFSETRLAHLNYFTFGDGNITNFLNAQNSLAVLAREERQIVFAREVVTRLVYLLSNLPADRNYLSLRGQTIATIINVSTQIGDLYTARRFYEIADDFIIQSIYPLKPYYYRYLYHTAQLLAASDEPTDLQESLDRINLAKELLNQASFDQSLKTVEVSMLQTSAIFIALKMRDWALAKNLFLTHPIYRNRKDDLKKEIQFAHEIYFYATGLLLFDSEVLNQHELPKFDPRIFEIAYSWEGTEATGTVLKFTRLLGHYVHKKRTFGEIDQATINEAFRVLLDQIHRDIGPSSTLSAHPPFYFKPLADYYLFEASRQKLTVQAADLLKLIDSLNRSPAQIYGDFLASAPQKGTSQYFVAHTLFDLTSNRLDLEAAVITNSIEGLKVSTKQKDALVKVNSSIEALSEAAHSDWQTRRGADFLETDIRAGNSLIFGYEMGNYINLYCTNGLRTFYSGGWSFDAIHTAANQLKNALSQRGAYAKKWQDFPFDAAAVLGRLIYNEKFSECFDDGSKITFVPFKPLVGIPLSTFLQKQYFGPFKSAPWGIKYNSFSYANSIKEAFNSFFDEHDVAAKNFLGLANPIFAPNANEMSLLAMDASHEEIALGTRSLSVSGFASLPETEFELKTISEFFREPKLITQENATERLLRASYLNNFDVLAFATHGALANEAEGVIDPSLILTQETKKHKGYKSKTTDGILTANEIAKLNLRASIVSLSACNTATQDLSSSSKNVQSLASAFRLAGVDNVVSNLWSVETYAAAALNVDMFRIWTSQRVSISESLRRAQLNYISNVEEAKASPAFWGASIVIGAGQSIANEQIKTHGSPKVLLGSETGYVSGVASGKGDNLLVSKAIVRTPGRLSPKVEITTFDEPNGSKNLDFRKVQGSAIMQESLGRNLMWSITHRGDANEEFQAAPMISEYDNLGNLLWNYQYPLKEGTFASTYSVSALPNGNIFALIHSDLNNKDDGFETSLIGVILSDKGKFLKEEIYYVSSEPMPLNRSLVISPATDSPYFGFIINISKPGHTGRLKGDLGEVFYCSEPEALIFLVDHENYKIFASDKIQNFWIDDALDTGDGVYFSGARSEKCRFNFVMGGIPSFGIYKDMEFTILHEDSSFVPSKITDVEPLENEIYFTQIWRPPVDGVAARAFEDYDDTLDELWDISEPTETEDSVYSFIGVGKWKSKKNLELDFLPLNNFWAEGAKIKNRSAVFFGKFGSKAAMVSAPFH